MWPSDPTHVATTAVTSSTDSFATFANEIKSTFSRMDPIPDEDWPPSIGRHESNLVMIEHGRDTLPGAKEAKQMQRDYVGGKVDRITEGKKEIRYEEIFDLKANVVNSKKVPYESKHFRMLIDGAPGVGKTTLCRKFCKDWGAGKILQQFSIVWLLNLREETIAKAKSLDDLFQHYNMKLLKKVLKHIKETGGEGNLLVCDGFDELSEKERTQHSLFLDIIRGKKLPNCSVIVSSRPYASQMLQQIKNITHHVEIVGFTEKQIKECIRQNVNDKPKAEELIEQLKQRLDILSLCYTPLNAAITLYVYKQEEHTLPTTLTQLYTLYILHSLKRSVKIHFDNLDANDITDVKNLPDSIALPFIALCEMAYNGLQDDQLGFSMSQLPQSLQGCPGCKGTKPDLLGLMSGSKRFTGSNADVSYQFTHLTVQEFLAAWHAAIVLSAEEQSKLFIEKANDDRFRMMLLFLAGITGMQDKQVYQQVVHNTYPQVQVQKSLQDVHLFFLSHLIYESQNDILSPILASAMQLDGKLKLSFFGCDMFQCTVFACFLSTCNFPLQLDFVTDEQMDAIYRVCCRISGVREAQNSSAENPLFFKELSLCYEFDARTPSPKPSSFSYLLSMNLASLSLKCDTKSCSIMTKVFSQLKQQLTLERLHINTLHEELDTGALEALESMLKTNASIQCLKMAGHLLCYDDLTSRHIAAVLGQNHSLKELDISDYNITSVGAVRIFGALVSNTTLESLDMSWNKILLTPNSPSLPSSSSNTSSLSPPSKVGAAMADMLSCNSTLTTLIVSDCGLTPQSCVPMFKALKHNSSLNKLIMNNMPAEQSNEFEEASEALADMLSFNHSLTELNITGCDCQPKALARGLLHNTTLTKVTVWDREMDSIMAALEGLRREEGHTQQPDPEVARCGQVLRRYVCMYTVCTVHWEIFCDKKESFIIIMENLL